MIPKPQSNHQFYAQIDQPFLIERFTNIFRFNSYFLTKVLLDSLKASPISNK